MKHVKTIGVIGGGQLGRMFAIDAKRMGYDVVTLDPQERSPAGQVAGHVQLDQRRGPLIVLSRPDEMCH